MSKILVLGGSRYFGKRLVQLLASEGQHQVTVATRGLTKVEFAGEVHQVVLDRSDETSLREVAQSGPWDIVYDNICYSPNEALAAVHAFEGHVGRYIVTSSASVYDFLDHPLVESDFDPYQYELKMGDRDAFGYAEGKRLVETVFMQKANFPVCAMRIPIVLGPDDYTRRLHFHIEHVKQGLKIGIPNPEAAISFITSGEVASFMKWLGTSSITGPVNGSSDGAVTIGQIIKMIEKASGNEARILSETEEEHMSPFGIPTSWTMDTSRAKAAGYSFHSVQEWLPELIHDIEGT
ncbi:NAD-dependent epimerase/dehydratase family protein [Paenibacillus sp. D2_2]|uniref:NAD-dependent epimerase/dehydratase family protein n=1 Tax=Paenibacillus sp. D2_2 TaxID=3073092 RepID=UPI002814B8F7|nr:NAD-dependent epimerase/dehydratase family protein [Paenibacillus sp. D2_2]WMT39057.1 NAD-dependent epimerase/dehydratase family protein [Paenibacillus sp. D2_2]